MRALPFVVTYFCIVSLAPFAAAQERAPPLFNRARVQLDLAGATVILKGGSGEQDAEVARAGSAALLDALKEKK